MSQCAKNRPYSRRFSPLGLCFAVLLTACSPQIEDNSLAVPPTAVSATEIGQVRSLHIAAGVCSPVLRHNLAAHGLQLAGGVEVDAVLRLELRHRRPLRESLPLIQSLGERAKYTATLTGAGDKALLSLYGEEGSLSLRELCDDIGDEIANKLAVYLQQDE